MVVGLALVAFLAGVFTARLLTGGFDFDFDLDLESIFGKRKPFRAGRKKVDSIYIIAQVCYDIAAPS